MSSGVNCAVGLSNQTMVCADGPELLVYEAQDGKPAWKEFCEDLLIAVAVAGGQVISVDASGRIVRWQNGRRLSEQAVGASVQLVDVSASGAVALASQTQVFLPRGGEHFSLAFEGATGICFDSNAAHVAVASASGQFVVLRVADGGTVGATSIPGGARGVAWNPRGFWCVATNGGVQVFASDGATLVTTISTAAGPITGAAEQVACSADGALIALTIGQSILVYDGLQYSHLGAIQYKRALGSIGFGGGALLYVGLDDGDANTVDLARGTSCRTEPHVGRGRTNWNFKANVDNAQVRGVIARAKTSGGPVASYVYTSPEEGKKRSGCKTGCMVVIALSVVCGGCSGLSGLLYYLFG